MNQTAEMTLTGSVVSGQPVSFLTYFGSCLPSSCRLANGVDPVAGIALDTGHDGDVITVQFEGNVETLYDNLVVATGYYATTSGGLTAAVGAADQLVGAANSHSALTLVIAHRDIQIAVGPEDLTASTTPSGGQVPSASTDTKSFVWTTNVTTDEKVSIDAAATPGYIGAASSDGVLRTSSPLAYTDGGDFVTISLPAPVTHTLTDAGLLTAPTVQTISHRSSGVAEAGFGTTLAIAGQNSVVPSEAITLATVAGIITDPADGTEDADLVISTMRAGTVLESARVPSTGGLTASGPLTATTTDAGTTNAPTLASLIHRSSGAAASGFGSALAFGAQNTATPIEAVIAGKIAAVMTDVADGTEDADLVFYAIRAGSLVEAFRVTSVGTIQTIGLSVTGATQLGDASTDEITMTGRAILRTLGSDPLDATPGNRPAGSVKEIAWYGDAVYVCKSAATPEWLKVGPA
jgi:hypothetical protein